MVIFGVDTLGAANIVYWRIAWHSSSTASIPWCHYRKYCSSCNVLVAHSAHAIRNSKSILLYKVYLNHTEQDTWYMIRDTLYYAKKVSITQQFLLNAMNFEREKSNKKNWNLIHRLVNEGSVPANGWLETKVDENSFIRFFFNELESNTELISIIAHARCVDDMPCEVVINKTDSCQNVRESATFLCFFLPR